MSVFEVLRYSEIDLANLETLLALPDALMLKYWLLVHEGTNDEYEPAPPFNKMCSRLSVWAKHATTNTEKEYVKQKFLRALREVDPL